MKSSPCSKDFLLLSKRTTRSQKRKAAEELVSQDLETPIAENNQSENLIAGPINSPKMDLEKNLEIKTFIRKKVLLDIAKIIAENQKEMLELIAPTSLEQTYNS